MFGKKTLVVDDVEQRLSVGSLRNARGVEPLDYAIPSDTEFEVGLLVRLEKLIASGATDVETIAVLDEEIRSRQRVDHDDLETQRVTHVKVCKSIVDVARMNVTQAQDELARADVRLARAQRSLDALEAKLELRDPELNHRA